MKLDIKLPIGLLFTLFGITLTLYGLFTGNDASLYAKSLDINVNLWTGLVMLIFGLLMLMMSRKSKKEKD